jgi:hypothetical protein
MVRTRLNYVGFLTLLMLAASSAQPKIADPVNLQAIAITSRAVLDARARTRAPLHFLNAWSLKSSYKFFGGVSALLHSPSGFTALGDGGILFHFDVAGSAEIVGARAAPLPKGCAPDRIKYSLDSESLARDPTDGSVLIGFEWRNAICRANASLTRALAVARPRAMRDWPANGGAEAIVALRDGRTLVFEERPAWAPETGEVLIFTGDPTQPDAASQSFRYRPPPGFRPTDATELPDGGLLIVNRHYQFPISFATALTILPANLIKSGSVVSGEEVARLESPTLADNFEAIALSQSGEHTFVWLMSDNNFNAYQRTYLVQFELLGR